MMRRALLQMLAAPLLARRSDGLVRPLNAPPGQGVAPGVQPGVSNAVEIANLVIIFGVHGGLFVYSPSPGAGNLIASIVPQAGTDQFGNTYVAGVTSYGPGGFTELFGGLVNFRLGSFISESSTGLLTLSSPAINNLAPFLNPVDAVHPGTTSTRETWQPMTPLHTGFGASSPAPRYKLYADNTVRLSGFVALTANQAANTPFFTLPSGYVPSAASQFFATVNTLSGATVGRGIVEVTSAGVLQIASSGTSGNFLSLDGITFPLD